MALRIEHGTAARQRVVGAEHVAGGGLRVAADVAVGVVLEAGLQVVAAGDRARSASSSASPWPGGCCGPRDRSNPGTARRRSGRPARPTRRASGTASSRMSVSVPPALRAPKWRPDTCSGGQRGAAQHAAIGRHPQVVRVLPVHHRRQLDRAADRRLVRRRAVVQVAALHRVVRRDRAGQLELARACSWSRSRRGCRSRAAARASRRSATGPP